MPLILDITYNKTKNRNKYSFSSVVKCLSDGMIIAMSLIVAILHTGVNIREYVLVSLSELLQTIHK